MDISVPDRSPPDPNGVLRARSVVRPAGQPGLPGRNVRRPALRGRSTELAELARLLDGVRSGDSRTLLIRGEPGMGKSALLDHLAERASDCTVVRVVAHAAEADFAFSALHQMCAPLIDHLDGLPGPQRTAITTAFGLTDGPAPDPFLLGLAVLSLLSAAAAAQPVVCTIDDAQWLDLASAQVLGFVARRLGAESVALVFTRRTGEPGPSVDGIPEMALRGLADDDARALLRTVIPGPLDPRVRDRIIAETRGNPLAILELPQGLTHAELAGGFGLAFADGLSGRIEDSFHRRLAHLSADDRRVVLLAAAEPLGDPELLWRAADRCGIDTDRIDPASFDGLLQWGARVTFRHPLVRSAVYRTASAAERRDAHRVLAEVTDPERDADRRAWHLAQAAARPDESVALELERSASRAQARGGFAAAAAFLERAVSLSPDPATRASRALAAAEAKHRGGLAGDVLALLDVAEAGPLDERQRAQLGLLRARAVAALDRGVEVPRLLLTAAAQLEPLDARLARDTYLEALTAAQFAGRLLPGGVLDAADTARRLPPPAGTPLAQDELLHAQSILITEGFPAGVPLVRRAVERFVREDLRGPDALRWNWDACRVAAYIWDFDSWQTLAHRIVDVARTAGALSALPMVLPFLVAQRTLAGELHRVGPLNEELTATTEAAGVPPFPYGTIQYVAWQGRESEARSYIDAVERDTAARGEGLGITAASMARAILCNGLGRHEEALAAAERGAQHPEDILYCNGSLSELVEAAARCHRHALAQAALERLSARTSASGSDWALGIEARCRALVARDDEAEYHYRDAIARLERTPVKAELARAHLVFGEWLRRERRRTEARRELRTAHDLCADMGLEAFGARAARELAATGETARRRDDDTRNELTPREGQIARMAAAGLSNPEIGTRLFLSTRTVEYHLRKVFTKLDISSRMQLAGALGSPPS